MLLRSTTLIALATLTACGSKADQPVNDPIQLDWTTGQSFHLAASTRVGEVMAEENPVSLDGEPMTGSLFGDQWTDEVVWTYQVVETGLVPQPDDELRPFAEKADGELASLAVLKVTLDPTLNDDASLLEADPVTYLVFREDRDRLAGIISFRNVAGERVERAWSSEHLGRSWSVLSQSHLSAVPTYLAPYSADWSDGERRLENGSWVTSRALDDGTVDVYYDDELDGGLVSSRYEVGQPWPTWTVAENLEARLLSEDEVDDIRAGMPFMYPDDAEDFDYRAALSASLDVDSALLIDQEMIDDGGFEAGVRDGYEPWAGSWWPLKHGDLVFGYEGRDTVSDRIKDQVDPIKNDMDALSKEIRDMDAGDAKDAKVEEYQGKQQELIDVIVDFYGGLMTDLDGGKLRVEDGKLTHEDGWSYDLDELSPMDKFALVEYLDGHTNPNPFYLPGWEILNSYNPGGEGWWGHCNGWSAAAILTNEPTETVDVQAGGADLGFTSADLKGLLTEAHYSTQSRFYGQRYNDEDDDITDLSPAHFQKIISFYIKEQGIPLVFDTTADSAVWNFPAYQVELVLDETTDSSLAELVNINTASVDELDELPGIGGTLATRIVDYRELNGPFQTAEELMDVSGIGEGRYEDVADLITVDTFERTFDVIVEVNLVSDAVDETHVDGSWGPESFTETWSYSLVTDADGVVLRGTWDVEDEHPDFAWVPYANSHSPASGSSENPYLNYGHLLDTIGEDFERR